MQIQLGDTVDGVLNLALIGRLDTPGVDRIETKLTAHLVPRGGHATIDLSQVTFMGSGGIRMFITIARALGRKGGRLVLYGAQPLVAAPGQDHRDGHRGGRRLDWGEGTA